MRLLFITGNLNKLLEARSILKGHTIDHMSIKLPELQGDRVSITKAKAEYAANNLGKTVIVDDTSLCFNALGGMPGPYIAEFVKSMSCAKIAKMLHGFHDKRAKAICSIGYCAPGKNARVFEGITYGRIVKPKGSSNFGWDPIFVPNRTKKTYALMTLSEKNRISHRTKALVKLGDFILKKEK